ncbi:MAG TPA: site-specific integrase, partial [Vicinamibacterales bacterium]|nr:site-specific integrase [Vicinamibacterales bacterium]
MGQRKVHAPAAPDAAGREDSRGTPDGGRGLAALTDAYLDHLAVERRLSPLTIESYARDLVALGRFLEGEGRPLGECSRQDLEAFVRGLIAAGLSPRSAARAVACVRGFFRFLVLDRRLAVNPADDLRAPHAWPALPRFLAIDEVDRLIAQPDPSTPRGVRDRAMIEVLYATGLRVSELVGLC